MNTPYCYLSTITGCYKESCTQKFEATIKKCLDATREMYYCMTSIVLGLTLAVHMGDKVDFPSVTSLCLTVKSAI